MKFQSLLFTMLVAVLGFGQVPTITSFSPTRGPVGTTVTITGTNFSTTAANNIVRFGSVRAVVSTASTTSLTVTVPSGSIHEFITITVGSLTASSKLKLKNAIAIFMFQMLFHLGEALVKTIYGNPFLIVL